MLAMTMFSNGMWLRLLNMEQGVQTTTQNFENPMNNFNRLGIMM
jgi:hypothetical protein